MKLPHLTLAILLLPLTGCATASHSAWRQGTTTINVTGRPGTRISGFYVQDGQRHKFSDAVPFTLSERAVSEVEIRKVNPDESITVETRYEDPERHLSYANMAAGLGVPGVHVELRKGFWVENLRK